MYLYLPPVWLKTWKIQNKPFLKHFVHNNYCLFKNEILILNIKCNILDTLQLVVLHILKSIQGQPHEKHANDLHTGKKINKNTFNFKEKIIDVAFIHIKKIASFYFDLIKTTTKITKYQITSTLVQPMRK